MSAVKRFNTKEVITVACAVFRESNNKVVREGITSSKDRIMAHFNTTVPIAVTESDVEMANTMLLYLQQKTVLNALIGAKISPFVEDVVRITENPTISERDFGRIVWLPKLYADMIARDEVKQDLAHYTINSIYVGKIKDKIKINFIPLAVSYVRDYNCFRHLGHDGNGNLIGFLNKEKISGSIRGRVKKHEVSTYHGGARITYLNYVQGSA